MNEPLLFILLSTTSSYIKTSLHKVVLSMLAEALESNKTKHL